MTRLKLCPFCKKHKAATKHKGFGNWSVMCTNIACTVQPRTKLCISEDAAVAAWNYRGAANR